MRWIVLKWAVFPRPVALFGLLLCLLVMSGCGADVASNGRLGATDTPGLRGSVTPCSDVACGAASIGSGAQNLQVFVEPEAGEAPVVQAIDSARTSVWVEVYLLTDYKVITALEDAANRGVRVHVILELHPYGIGSTAPNRTLQQLQAAGVEVEGSDPAYHYTHEKAIVIDGATLLIMTSNLTRSGLGGSSYSENREYGIIDTNAADVREAERIFDADWQRTSPTLGDPNLVVSPTNARARVTGFISSAKSSLVVEDEEMSDRQSEDALIAEAQRGVTVEVILPQPSSTSGANADVARLLQGGVHVRYISTVYMHAKMMIADGSHAFVGSENFSANSLDDNRELGILIADSGVISTLNQTFQDDWSTARSAD